MKINMKKRVVITIGFMGLALAYGTGKHAATIKEWSMVSSNVMRLVFQHSATNANYKLEHTDSLINTNWQEVAHSDATNGTYVITNLAYSGNTSNNESFIYVQAESTQEFYRVQFDPE